MTVNSLSASLYAQSNSPLYFPAIALMLFVPRPWKPPEFFEVLSDLPTDCGLRSLELTQESISNSLTLFIESSIVFFSETLAASTALSRILLRSVIRSGASINERFAVLILYSKLIPLESQIDLYLLSSKSRNLFFVLPNIEWYFISP